MLWGLMASGRTARQILTMEAFENAIAVVYALGGSTNAVLHLLAIAREVSSPLSVDFITRGQQSHKCVCVCFFVFLFFCVDTRALTYASVVGAKRGHGALHAGKSLCKHPRLDLNTPAFCNLVCVPLPFPSPFPTAL